MRQTIKLFTLLLATTLTVACSSDDDRDNSTAGQNINRNDASQEPALQRLEFPKVERCTMPVATSPSITPR